MLWLAAETSKEDWAFQTFPAVLSHLPPCWNSFILPFIKQIFFLIQYHLNTVSPPFTLPPSFPSPLLSETISFCLSLQKNGLLGDNNKTQQNKI